MLFSATVADFRASRSSGEMSGIERVLPDPDDQVFLDVAVAANADAIVTGNARHFPDDSHSSNTWGILPPRTYFKFDRASLEAEREQAYAYEDHAHALP